MPRQNQASVVHTNLQNSEDTNVTLGESVQKKYKPFFFQGFRTFSDLAPLFSELDKPAIFFQNSSNFFRAIFRVMACSTVHKPPPTNRSWSDPPPNPQSHAGPTGSPKMGFFMPAGPAVALGWASRNSNKFQVQKSSQRDNVQKNQNSQQQFQKS